MITVICDGCGNPAPEYQARGMVDVKHYCLACNVVYDEYEKERNIAHDHVQKVWENSIKTLNRKWVKKLKELPDA